MRLEVELEVSNPSSEHASSCHSRHPDIFFNPFIGCENLFCCLLQALHLLRGVGVSARCIRGVLPSRAHRIHGVIRAAYCD